MIIKNVAIIGVSGLVGKELLSLIEMGKFPLKKLFGTSRNCPNFSFHGVMHPTTSIEKLYQQKVDLLFFCVPSAIAKKWIPQFLSKGCQIVDLSSAFRNKVPLVIPHLNGSLVNGNKHISSPNCVAAIVCTALFQLHHEHSIINIKGSSYQAASGGGRQLLNRLLTETQDYLEGKISDHPLPFHFNVFPHEKKEDEEKKISDEILHLLPGVKGVHINAVRVPTKRVHALSLFIELSSAPNKEKIKKIFENTKGVNYVEKCTPLDAQKNNTVFVSNLSLDQTHPRGITVWIMGDQLRRGAAFNALEIANHLCYTFSHDVPTY